MRARFRFSRNVVLCCGLLVLFLSSQIAAQTVTFDGVRASSCVTQLQVDGVLSTFNFPITGAVPAGTRLMFYYYMSDNIVITSQGDDASNVYTFHLSRFQSPRLARGYSTEVTTPLTTSNNATVGITPNPGQGGGNLTICGVVLAFSNVASSGSTAHNAETSVTLHSTNTVNTTQENSLLTAAYFGVSDPGILTIAGPFTQLAATCDSTNTSFCIYPGYSIVNTMGTFGSTAATFLAVDSMSSITFFNDDQVPVELQTFAVD